MSKHQRVALTKLETGVPGLDEVLGGGLPEYSFNLIAGEPGAGKTTLAHQILYANASAERQALYFTVLGEPPLKMLRYLQQMSFFEPEKVGTVIHFMDLSEEVLQGDLGKVLQRIVDKVKATEPALVVVDSFRTVVRSRLGTEGGELELQSFLQRLALHLTSWQATTFLVGEYAETEMRDNPIFTVADGIIWLSQSKERNSVVRKVQVMKLRGQETMPGLHTFRISGSGLRVFPRIQRRLGRPDRQEPGARASTGIPGLDAMLHGGIPQGDVLLAAGPSGVGKTCLGTQFIAAGAERGEAGVVVVFEEHPDDYLQRATNMGFDLASLAESGAVKVISLRPLDLSVDETLHEIRHAVDALGATRLVIDSLSGFEVALAPAARDDFRESLYRMIGNLTGAGVTIVMTVEVIEAFDGLPSSPHAISFLSEDLLLMRYVEMHGALRKVMAVVKMRRSSHATELNEYEVTARGIVVRGPVGALTGMVPGSPRSRQDPARAAYPGLTDEESRLLDVLAGLREADDQAIAAATGLGSPALARALDRLVALDYAVKVIDNRGTLYRPSRRTQST
jgi:circadian clock protein KaiC